MTVANQIGVERAPAVPVLMPARNIARCLDRSVGRTSFRDLEAEIIAREGGWLRGAAEVPGSPGRVADTVTAPRPRVEVRARRKESGA